MSETKVQTAKEFWTKQGNKDGVQRIPSAKEVVNEAIAKPAKKGK